MRISLRWPRRRRTVVSAAGSVVAHLLVVTALVWVKPPSTAFVVARGEPIFVELPEADAPAQRGLPAVPPAPRRAAPPRAPARPVPTPSLAPKSAPAEPTAPVVAKAAPVPEPVTPPPAPPEALVPAPATPAPPPAKAPTPAEPPGEAPRATQEGAGGPKVAAVPSAREPIPDIRSALRRDPGGAGGAGEGWAGIEGEPIPLDSKDKRYSDYLDRVRRMIKAKWIYPCVKNEATGECEYKSAKLVIVFGILRDGRVPRVDVAERSHYEIYDDVAVTAIKLASPFPPVPPELMAVSTPGSAGIRIVASFHYLLESSLANILR